jgi:hypothetical protein
MANTALAKKVAERNLLLFICDAPNLRSKAGSKASKETRRAQRGKP